MITRLKILAVTGCALLAGTMPCFASSHIDLSRAVVVVRPGELSNAEHTAAIVLVEEVEKRMHLHFATTSEWPLARTMIVITSRTDVPTWAHAIPAPGNDQAAAAKLEGYRIYTETRLKAPPILWIIGSDPRGTLFGVGAFLRKMDWSPGKLSVQTPMDISSSPEYAIRGHQLGYRPQANSYDTWSVAQYEQYIRELTFFGVNSIEAIPFPESPPNAYMKVSLRDMNRALGDICFRYGLDYWVWTPVPFDLNNTEQRSRELERDEQFFKDTKTLTAVFIPSGDPGKNSPELLLKFAKDVSRLLLAAHPNARIWRSLQGLKASQAEVIYTFLNRNSPTWIGGLVAGPSGPPIEEMRARLPKQYKLRLYPDITHSKLAEYEVPQWDQAFALTEGRQSIDPRPVEFAEIFHRDAPYSDGFISYSDGVHDDVNKFIWSALSWNSNQKVRDILVDYAHTFFNPKAAQGGADGILALEGNWHGALITHGAVEAALQNWERMQRLDPELTGNWRWQLCLLRANYDAYIRDRLIYQTALEEEADLVLGQAQKLGSERAMAAASDVLHRPTEQPVSIDLRSRIESLCEALFRSIGLQTSVLKYGATNPQRGAVLDFIDLPLNNQWWLEDEFAKIER